MNAAGGSIGLESELYGCFIPGLVECDGEEMTRLCSLFTLYGPSFSQRHLRGDLVLVCNCVRVLPHASSVSSPNLHRLSPDRRYPPQIRIQCPHLAHPKGKGIPRASPVTSK